MSKRKKNRGMRCVLFPDDLKEAFTKCRTEAAQTSTPDTKSWERCHESFLDTSVIQNLQTSKKKIRGIRKVIQTHNTGNIEAGTDEPVHIAWSSSENEDSDDDNPQTPQTSRAQKQHHVDYHRSLRMLSTGVETDDQPSIDSDSEEDEDKSSSKNHDSLNPVSSQAEISVYSSNDEEDPDENTADVPPDLAETSGQSVIEWVRSAQMFLQTPQKQTTKTIKTPEDSSKKSRKFERGGFAEKLNRLHSRQRSAISFWRHRCNSSTLAADRPGVLTLRILGVREECGMQAAVCDRLPENEKYVALFSKDTVAQLQPTTGDVIHIYPPWQTLVVDGELYPIILNTHFSQKVCIDTDNSDPSRSVISVEKCRPPELTRCLWKTETNQESHEKSFTSEQPQVSELSCPDRIGVRDSLLDAVEDCGSPGSQSGPVEVVVQRIYCIPNRTSLQPKTPDKSPSRSESSSHIGRLCAVVQDVYGMFADVLMHYVSSDREIREISGELEGRVCVLRGLRVIQRLTRDRCSSLFGMIDGLWPPLVAPKSHEGLLQSPSGRVPPPNFCYRLSVQQGHMVPLSGRTVSNLYRPPVLQTLKEIIQDDSSRHHCSFRATVVHKHLLSSNGSESEMLLFVTDSSLQSNPDIKNGRKTISLCLRPSCLIQRSVIQALDVPQNRHVLSFRDAVKEQGQIFCVEQTVIHLEPEDPSFNVSRPIILDQLGPETSLYSLCTITGVIVEVDESTAFSWPACIRCESCRLEAAQGQQEGFHCLMCGTTMNQPSTKMQLDVFLNCPSLRNSTVKVKLQQNTINSLLNSTKRTEGYTVENVLGMEIGPLSALVHVISRSQKVWMGLEELTI